MATEIGLEDNSAVELSLRNGKLVIAPVSQPALSLEQLLSQVTKQNLHGEVDTGSALEIGTGYLKQGEIENAAAVFQAAADDVLEHFEAFHDESGELGATVQRRSKAWENLWPRRPSRHCARASCMHSVRSIALTSVSAAAA